MPSSSSSNEFHVPSLAVQSPHRLAVWSILQIAGVYLGGYWLLHSLAIQFRTSLGVSPWYPPPALSLVLILWAGRRWIPLLFCASMLVQIFHPALGDTLASNMALSLVLMLGYGASGYGLRDVIRIDVALPRLRDVLWLAALGTLAMPLLVAALVMLSLVAFGTVFANNLLTSTLTFWIGDAIGIVTIAPFALLLRPYLQTHGWRGSLRRVWHNLDAEYWLQILSIVAVLWLGWRYQRFQSVSNFYFCALPLLWMAISHGLRRATLGILLTNLGLIVVFALPQSSVVSLVDLQLWMLMMSLSGLLIGAVVSERERAERELQRSELYFRSLIENTSDLISIVDSRGVVQYESPSSQRILGYNDGLKGQNIFEFVHPDDVAEVGDTFQRKLIGQRIGATAQYRFRHHDGSWRYLESVGNVMEPHEPLQIIINSRDVTERKWIEEALMAVAQNIASTTNDFYRTIAFYLWRALRVKIVCVGVLSPDKQRIEMLATCMDGVLIETMSYDIAGTPCDTVMQSESVHYYTDLANVFPNDTWLTEHAISSYMGVALRNADQQPIGILNILHVQPMDDLSMRESLLSIFAQRIMAELERSNAEQQRLQLERKMLEGQKLESLGLLAGGIAHDFNNFLTTISGNVGLALLETEPSSPVLDYLTTIETATRRAADLSRQMLAYSGKGRFVVSRINLTDLVQEMATLLQVSMSKHVRLQLNFTPHLPPVEVDATQIRQVVMNLIVNASDAIGNQPGRITLRTGTINADDMYIAKTMLSPDLPAGQYVFIEVSDTGVGMDAPTVAKIFEPFFTTKVTGRGLGLAAVQGIIRAHHGLLNVYSEIGRGSTFKVMLPSAETPTTLPPLPPPAFALHGGGLVLVIDDELAIRQTVARMLEWLGFRTLQAADSTAGFALIAQHSAEIVGVLLDMTMPGLNGEEMVREMRRRELTMPIILMSGYHQTDAINRLMTSGSLGFLHKPFTLEELQTTLTLYVSAAVGAKKF